MARLSEIMKALADKVSAALEAANIEAIVGSEWPGLQDRQNAGKDSAPPVVAIIHRMSTYKKEDLPFEYSETSHPISMAPVISDPVFSPGQVREITIEFAEDQTEIHEGDLLSCVLSNGDGNISVSVVAGEDETLETMAAGLAAEIIGSEGLPDIGAVADDNVITVTNNGTIGYKLASNAGVSSTVGIAIEWAYRSMQIGVWCGDLSLKYQIQPIIEDLLNGLSADEGFFLPSGELVRFKNGDAKPDDADTDKDVYVDWFLFTIKNIVDRKEPRYTVVAVSPEFG